MAYLTINGISTGINHLKSGYPALVDVIDLPERSFENRKIKALRLRAGTATDRRGVLFIGGTHARELVNPEIVLALGVKLCDAYTNGTGVSWGSKSFSATQVKLVMELLDIFLVPLVNPDGRRHVQKPGGEPMWRKNRADYGTGHIGVDLNRNLDFLWDFTLGVTSSSPSSDVYHGPSVFSESETRNVKWLLDTYDNIACFVDVHSYSELILYPWGDDDTQTVDPAQNFLNPTYDGLRGFAGGYAEYMTNRNKQRFEQTAQAIADAIKAVRGRTYTPQTSYDLYATTGTHSDYAFARHLADDSTRKVYGFTFETGREFQPPEAEKLEVIKEGCAGLMQMLIHCICAIELIGIDLFGPSDLTAMREFRDTEMTRSELGKRLVTAFEDHSGEISLIVSSRPKLASEAAEVVQAALESIQKDRAMPASVIEQAGSVAASLRRHGSPALREALDDMKPVMEEFSRRKVRTALGVRRPARPTKKKGR